MFRSSASLFLVVLVAVAISSLSTATSDFEFCFGFDPPLVTSSDVEEVTFGSCIIDAYNTENVPRGFKIDSVELVFEDDDSEGRRSLGKKKTSKKGKSKGKCNKNGCSSEAGNLIEQSCPGCRRNLEQDKFGFRGATRMIQRVLGGTSETKSNTELLLDDCVLYAYSASGILVEQATYGITLAPCSE